MLRPHAHRLGTVAACAVLVAGCGGAGDSRAREGNGSGDAAGAPDEALAWLPTSTWLVATGDLSDARIDGAVDTLRRLPSWAYLEGELPASDGAGVRAVAAAWAADRLGLAGDVDVERLGSRGGVAVTGGSVDELLGATAPAVAWVEVDDEAAARAQVRSLLGGRGERRSRRGVGYAVDPDRGVAWRVDDGLLLVATSGAVMRDLIDAHRSRDTLATETPARAVLGAVDRDAIATVAVATDPVLAWRGSEDADGTVPEWVAVSGTIDDVGVLVRGAWSGPREVGAPQPSPRERVERAPDTSTVVAAAPVAAAASGSVVLVRELGPAVVGIVDGVVGDLLGIGRGAVARQGSVRVAVDDGAALLTWPARPAGAGAGANDATPVGELPAYRDVVAAAEPPNTTSGWAWIDVPRLLDPALVAWAAGSTDRTRALPVVRGNVRALPGLVAWTDRARSDGVEVGTARAVLPIGP